MDTKRCVYCQKLARADAEVCSRCGHSFGRVRVLHDTSRRSIPPASPHHAGHYSGLHPEDQPYQSTMMSIVRPAESTEQQRHPQREPGGIILPSVDVPPVSPASPITPMPPVPPMSPVPLASPAPLLFPTSQRTQRTPLPLAASVYPSLPMTPLPESYNEEEQEADVDQRTIREALTALPTLPDRPPYMPAPIRSPFQRRPIMVTLSISFLLLLVASGLLAYMFISKKPQASLATATLLVTNNQLRVGDSFTLRGSGFGAIDLLTITRDTKKVPILDGNGNPLYLHTDALGAFSIPIMVGNWGSGEHIIQVTDEAQQLSDSVAITIEQPSASPPVLQLKASTLDFGTEAAGVVSRKNVTLSNVGGGQVNWQASSDQPWLTIAPGSGMFSGSGVVVITVNRGVLAPLSYSGHISFVQQGSQAKPLELTVSMAVKSAPASLTLSPVSLSYSGSTIQNPTSQTITMLNSGEQPLNWRAQALTGNGVAWLAIAPANGQLAPGASAVMNVSVQSQPLAVGTYSGTISFSGGTNPQVGIALTVVAPGNMIVSPPTLNFSAFTNQNPASQSITVQNSGGQLLNWTASTATTNGGKWLTVSPASGQLVSGAKETVTIATSVAGLQPNAYQGAVTFNYGTLNKPMAVSLTVSTPPVPSINTQVHALSFSTLKGTNPMPQTITITNTGNATLNWVANEDTVAATYAPVTPTSGSLAPATSATITVSPSVLQLGAGTLTGTITIADSDTGSTVPTQKIVVGITVLDQAVISVINSMNFSNDSTSQSTWQTLVLTNNGSADLNWTLTIPSSASWLSVDNASGTITPGASNVLDVTCDSSQLAPGTYTASLQISDSDPNTPVVSQTVDVVLVVS